MTLYFDIRRNLISNSGPIGNDYIEFESKSDFRKNISSKLFEILLERDDLNPETYRRYFKREIVCGEEHTIDKIKRLRKNKTNITVYLNRIVRENDMIIGCLVYKKIGEESENYFYIDKVKNSKNKDLIMNHFLNQIILKMKLELKFSLQGKLILGFNLLDDDKLNWMIKPIILNLSQENNLHQINMIELNMKMKGGFN